VCRRYFPGDLHFACRVESLSFLLPTKMRPQFPPFPDERVKEVGSFPGFPFPSYVMASAYNRQECLPSSSRDVSSEGAGPLLLLFLSFGGKEFVPYPEQNPLEGGGEGWFPFFFFFFI